MNSIRSVMLSVVLGSFVMAPFSAPAGASTDWPNRPLRVIIPVPPGGGPEFIIRRLTESLKNKLGQPVIVDYKPGASGNMGARDLATSAADGYSWMLGQESIFTINPHLYPDLGFKVSDIKPLAFVGSFVNALVCHPKVGVTSVAELVDKAKANPGKISYASAGAGSPGHLAMEMFANQAKINLAHVPYRGPMPAVQDLLGGHVDCAFLVTSIAAEHIRAGKLIGLASSGSSPSVSLPGLPNIADVGYPGFNATFWLGIFSAAEVEPAIRERFHQALVEAVADPAVHEAMIASDMKSEVTSPSDTQEKIQQLSDQWAAIIQQSKITVE